jgi:hypothetical protein
MFIRVLNGHGSATFFGSAEELGDVNRHVFDEVARGDGKPPNDLGHVKLLPQVHPFRLSHLFSSNPFNKELIEQL